jgi:eukaryotic-like serine/threonine-protein kinase
MMAYRLRDSDSRSSETVVSAVRAFEPGYVFAGKYRIERKLGEGGMGAVYAARHLDLGGRVALKVMLARVASTEASSRFTREARAASMLRGEHVVRTLDAGKLTNGTPYIVLEYVDGHDLEDLLAKRRVLPVEEAVALIVQACEGVAEAHASGMVHRDLTLRNMLLTKRVDGSPLLKILDFGVVKISASGLANTGTNPSITLTRADELIGSTHYMAPEQIHMSSKVDARADVWSLGVCLYRLLTGRWPFDGLTLAGVLMSIVGQDPTPVDHLRAEIPPELARAVGRALEKSVAGRFRNVAELAGAIAPLIGDYAAEKRINAILSPLDSETIRIERPAPISRPPTSRPPPSRSLGSTVHGVAPGPPPPCPTEERRPISAIIVAALVASLVVAAFVVATTYRALH